jgi:hypothetical protein
MHIEIDGDRWIDGGAELFDLFTGESGSHLTLVNAPIDPRNLVVFGQPRTALKITPLSGECFVSSPEALGRPSLHCMTHAELLLVLIGINDGDEHFWVPYVTVGCLALATINWIYRLFAKA